MGGSAVSRVISGKELRTWYAQRAALAKAVFIRVADEETISDREAWAHALCSQLFQHLSHSRFQVTRPATLLGLSCNLQR